jgi:vancomycin resistance protein VanJ
MTTTLPRVRLRTRLAAWLRTTLAIVIIAGLIVRLTIGDTVPPFTTIYYATPLPLLTAAILLSTVLAWRRGKIRWAWAAATIAILAWTIPTHWFRNTSAPTTASTIRVMLWNTGHGYFGNPERMAEIIRKVDADIVVLVEACPLVKPPELRAFWAERCPDHRVSLLGSWVVLLSKYPSGECTPKQLPFSSLTRQVDLEIDGQPLTLLVCDIGASPFVRRHLSLEPAFHDADLLLDRPALVLGDFNTPPDSQHFAPLRRNYRNAFLEQGNGYLATWPMPAPILGLDQIWANDQIEIHSCEHITTWSSDHRAVVATISLKRRQAADHRRQEAE